jgi:hypothetical protein
MYATSPDLGTFANKLFYSSGRFRGGGKNGGTKSPGPPNGAQPTSPTGTLQSGSSSTGLAPRMPPLPSSPSLSQTLSMDDSTGSLPSGDALSFYNLPRPKPIWLNDSYAKHIVKGNFMTLSARPKTVEQGEWIAHQGECLRPFSVPALLTHFAQSLSIIATSGTLYALSMTRTKMALRSVILKLVLACLLARRSPPVTLSTTRSNSF